MIVRIPLLLCMVFAVSPFGFSADDEDLARVFAAHHVRGTMIISTASGDTTYWFDSVRAHTRFLPASTFKIPNTLIALEEGAVKNGSEVIRWDGRDRGVAAWNRDHSLETAFPVSCVWFYQELARRVGNAVYESYLALLHYGNEKTGRDVMTFWLDGDLAISATEQVEFLRNIYRRKFPFKDSSYAFLRRIMIVESTPRCVVRAKSGRTGRAKPEIGWYVGYAESAGRVWFFAMNMDIAKDEDAVLRRDIALEGLRAKGIR